MNETYDNIGDLLEWFRAAPRTKRWDALLAFDQASTNKLLLQQYIERFGSDSYLTPVNGSIDLGSGKVAEIVDYVFDKPRLSFENANLQAPTATLRIQGLGGVRFTWDVTGATRKLESIAYELPVNGDVHESTVQITDRSVSVNNHQVIIDVSSGADPLLKLGGTLSEKKRAGAWMTSALNVKPPQVREYVLSELKGEAGSIIKPERVLLLTQPAPQSHRRDSARYGDGAVLAFVAMEGGVVGDRPTPGDPEWRYLLNANEGGHSMLMVLSHRWWMGEFVASFLTDPFDRPFPVQVTDDGDWKAISVPNGEMGVYWFGNVNTDSGDYYGPALADGVLTLTHENGSPALAIRRSENGLRWSWRGAGEAKVSVVNVGTNIAQRRRGVVKSDNSSRMYATLDDSAGRVLIIAETDETLSGSVFDEFNALPELATVDMRKTLAGTSMSKLTNKLMDINAVHLSNIVLPGDRAINLKGVDIPGDLVMYGNVSDERIGLELNQQEVMVGAGNSFQFSVNASDGVSWSVELVDGEAADAGTLSANGLYTAPALTSSYARVRATARRGASTTHALITVVRDLAAVSPAIQLAVAGSQARYFVRGGAAGDWQWDTSELKGTLKEPVPEPGDQFEPGDMQYIPPATIDTDFIVEQVKIRVGSNVTTSTIVVTKGSMLDVIATLSAGGQSATLKAQASGNEVPATFTKVAGSGRLEGDRVISEAQPAEPFIVVQGAMSGLPFAGYLLLPLPLAVLEGTRSQAVLQDPTLTF